MRKTLVDLETRFWQSMVDQDTDTAIYLLCQPSVMVGAHGVMRFDHDGEAPCESKAAKAQSAVGA